MRLNYDVFESRVKEVLKENGELPEKPSGVAKDLLYQITHYPQVKVGTLLDFASRYGVSIDWLFGRTDKYWL